MEDAEKLLKNWRQSPPRDAVKCADALKVMAFLEMNVEKNNEGHYEANHPALLHNSYFAFGGFTMSCHALEDQAKRIRKRSKTCSKQPKSYRTPSEKKQKKMKTIQIENTEITAENQAQQNRARWQFIQSKSPLSPKMTGAASKPFFLRWRGALSGTGQPLRKRFPISTSWRPLFEPDEENSADAPRDRCRKRLGRVQRQVQCARSRVLHAQLVGLAEDQGVSLNSLVQTLLTSGATALAAGKQFGAVTSCAEASAHHPRNGSSA